MADLIEVRISEIDASCQKSSLNRFLGFCRGIVCDGVITTREAQRLVEEVLNNKNLLESRGVRQIYISAVDALEDGIVSQEESLFICEVLGGIVGDCYGDTGLPQAFGVANFDEFKLSNLDEDLLDKTVVLTGTFSVVPRSHFEKNLQERGAILSRSVSGKTDYIIIGGEASRDWIEMNRGTKLIKAQELRAKTGRPDFVSESQLLRLMS